MSPAGFAGPAASSHESDPVTSCDRCIRLVGDSARSYRPVSSLDPYFWQVTMDRRRFFSWLAPLLVASVTAADAQEMRIYTTVRNLAAPAGESAERSPVIARTLTLFHAGKVYDYVDSAKEVTVFEPSHHRFTLLNERRRTVTEVSQDEIRQFLALVEEEGWKRLQNAQKQGEQLRSLGWLKFQLKPEFQVSFDPAKSTLTLVDRSARYKAEGQAPPSKGVVESYLRFADATAELNSVLHPRAPLPKPRLQLNDELLQRQLLPVSVELEASLDAPLHLQSRHEWTWKFQSTDRQLISGWDKQLNDATLRRITFRQYQQESLSMEVTRDR